jgi:FlaA1/EpsC-like NDP-sugar epimerase
MHYRNLLAFLHDIVAAGIVWYVSYWLRFNMEIPALYADGMLKTLLVAVPLQALCFWQFGLYRGIWRYASLSDLQRILASVGLAGIAIAALVFMTSLQQLVPRSVLVLDPLLLVLAMGGSRFAYRAWREHRLYGEMRLRGEPVLVLGAGDTAVSLLKDFSRSEEWRVVGLLDDDPAKLGRLINGVRVLGPLKEVTRWSTQMQVTQVIVALPSASARIRRRAVEMASRAGLNVLTVPSFDDLLSGKVTVSQVRRIELDDLLGRDPVKLDTAGLQGLLGGGVIMISGAGGSIGAELCRQISRFQPRQLVFFELNEFSLYRLEQEFRRDFPGIDIVCAIGDVKNAPRVAQVIRKYRPSVVFHAAAYKHVPLMESENAWEAVLNNALGSYCIAATAAAEGVEKFVLISTDKAVNPTNVMGASKRLAEIVCQSLQKPGGMQIVLVRFGNVLGSAGSVVPKFREQIAAGGPITVTHPEITRFFMSIPEAAQLVLQAGFMGRDGEIYVLDMGEPVRIVDMARDLIRLSGFTEDDIKISFTGLRAGEKLYEELLADEEHTLPTPHPKLRIAKARPATADMALEILRWLNQAGPVDDATVRSQMRSWLPEYGVSIVTAEHAVEANDSGRRSPQFS